MIYGVATNDLSGHITQKVEYYKDENGKSRRKIIWQCPFYQRWFAMLTRCYKSSELARHPTYSNKTVCSEWLIFSNFKAWMEQQDWQGKDLDKDILVDGNTEYRPDRCIFIDQRVNKFLLEKTEIRDLPIGVHFHKKKQKYIVQSGGKQVGAYDNRNSAELAWCRDKLRQAKEIAESLIDKTVAAAIVKRYTVKLINVEEKQDGNRVT